MKPLLPFNHPTYLRRLVRELNHRPAGFYHDGQRWYRATFSVHGGLRIWRLVGYAANGGRNEVSKSFGECPYGLFDDGQGNDITARRAQ